MTKCYVSPLAPLLALCAAAVAQGGTATIYGIKSCGSSPGVCASVPSTTPAHLFRFLAGGGGLADLGLLRENGTAVDVDGLAWSAAFGLCGFVLVPGSPIRSALATVDPATAAVTRRGALLDREIRGAVFAADDTLFVLDATQSLLLRVDPVTGTELGSPVSITVAGQPFAVTNVCDLAVRDDGALFMVAMDRILALDPVSGAATSLAVDPGQAIAGAVFPRGRPSSELCVYEVTASEDIYRYDLAAPGVPRSSLMLNILSSYNAGRGDLAALRREDVFARCSFRNGRGLNPSDYGCVSPPVLGTVWQTAIAMTPNSVASFVAIGILPEPGIPFDGGEILIGLVPEPMLLVGVGAHALTIPNVSALLGVMVPTQGFRLDAVGPINVLVPLNAEDLVLGT